MFISVLFIWYILDLLDELLIEGSNHDGIYVLWSLPETAGRNQTLAVLPDWEGILAQSGNTGP